MIFFNAERFMEEALASVYGQTCDDWELILVDDGSTDRSTDIALKHARESAVHPLTGELITGVEHAPLLYARDPRLDLPSELQHHLRETVQDSDARIVAGWLGR